MLGKRVMVSDRDKENTSYFARLNSLTIIHNTQFNGVANGWR